MPNAIRRLRTERKWTAVELARLVGVTEVAVLRWEKGQSRPRHHHAEVLARRLKVTVEDLDLDNSEPDPAARCA